MPKQEQAMAAALRQLADQIEAGEVARVGVYEHVEPIRDIQWGGQYGPPVDAKWWGRSIVIHIGSPGWANDMALRERLRKSALSELTVPHGLPIPG